MSKTHLNGPTTVFILLFLITGCGGSDPSTGSSLSTTSPLFGIGGLVWPGPTSEFDKWINKDLNCGQYTMTLTGDSSTADLTNFQKQF